MVRKKEESLFRKALSLIRHHHLQIWKTFGTDLLILLLIATISYNLDLLLTQSVGANFVVFLIYLAVIITIYTLGKWFIQTKINAIVGASSKKKSKAQFARLNIIQWIVITLITGIITSSLYYGIYEGRRGVIGAMLYFIIFIISYVFYNLSHAVFFKEKTIPKILTSTFSILKKNITPIFKLWTINVLALIGFSLIFLIVGKLIEVHYGTSLVPPDVVRVYDILFGVTAFVFLIAVHYFNRVCLTLLARKS